MKPRTKLQVRVKALSDALPKITEEQKLWAFKHCLKHLAYRTKTKTACLDCGHMWPTGDTRLLLVSLGETHYDCPNCGTRVAVEDTRKKLRSQRAFMSVIDVANEFQVIRHYEIYGHYKSGTKPRLFCYEVAQLWLRPNQNDVIVAKNRGTGYCDNFHGDMEIKPNTDLWGNNAIYKKYNIFPNGVHPKMNCLTIYRRNGFNGKFHDTTPYLLFSSIVSDAMAETLLKSKQFELFAARVGNKKHDVGRYWDSVKICIRNKYIIKYATSWLDYLDLLRYFKKDLRSPAYICPKNLKLVHDKLVARKKEIEDTERYTRQLIQLGKTAASIKNMSAAGLQAEYDRIMAAKNEAQRLKQLEENRKVAEKKEAAYAAAKGIFFGLVFSEDNLLVKVLESVNEFIEEGDAHKHCIFTNRYYERKDSLILSARIDDKLVETIEIDLTAMKVVQSRGFGNQASPYNKQIRELLEKNIGIIRQKYKEATKPKKHNTAIAA
jgi:hypothetical protein